MLIRYAGVILTLAGTLALALGLLFWTGNALHLASLHMLLGFLAVGSLWVIGIGQLFTSKGSWAIAVSIFLLGALTVFVGLYQASLLTGDSHWIIEVLHLLLGLLTIGLGHMAVARHRKASTGKLQTGHFS